MLVVTSAADRRLASFEEHRRSRIGGSFLTAGELEQERGRSLSDVLQSVSGADIVRLGGGMAYFATRRGYDSFRNMPGISEGGDELFDLNSLAPDEILAIEVCKGGATMPLEYNATRKTCGLLVIFTE
ncbi:Plug domain-containing protein [Gemmatimonas sp.]|uniref:Plug domain-containing protein n=1 Tax=Gemmatimonas sp. TaxID=1962908 RepID=UPI00286DC9C5|nr:Plug domain-containing protein [Gemmatimonas sp.]